MYKAYQIVRINGGYAIIEITFDDKKKITSITQLYPEDVYAITEAKLTKLMKPV